MDASRRASSRLERGEEDRLFRDPAEKTLCQVEETRLELAFFSPSFPSLTWTSKADTPHTAVVWRSETKRCARTTKRNLLSD